MLAYEIIWPLGDWVILSLCGPIRECTSKTDLYEHSRWQMGITPCVDHDKGEGTVMVNDRTLSSITALPLFAPGK